MGEKLPEPGLLKRLLRMGRIGRGTQQVHGFIRLLVVSSDITTAPLACRPLLHWLLPVEELGAPWLV